METSLWDGLEGLEQFYLGIARLFNLGHEAEAAITSRRKLIQQHLRDAGLTLQGKSCALCLGLPGMLPLAARLTHGMLDIRVKYFLLSVEKHDPL